MANLTNKEKLERYDKLLAKAKQNMQINRRAKKDKGLRQITVWSPFPKAKKGMTFELMVISQRDLELLRSMGMYFIVTFNEAKQPQIQQRYYNDKPNPNDSTRSKAQSGSTNQATKA